jgi:hypothetical protein
MERARVAVLDWAARTMGWGPDDVTAAAAPQLSTPGFDFVLLAQRRLREAGEIPVMTDGRAVLPAGEASLGRVLAAEGLAEDPDALPASLVAELSMRLAEPGGGRAVTTPDDPALAGLAAEDRARFEPPRVTRDGDGARASFWSARGPGSRAELRRWTVRVGPDGTVERTAEPVTG